MKVLRPGVAMSIALLCVASLGLAGATYQNVQACFRYRFDNGCTTSLTYGIPGDAKLVGTAR